MSLFWNLEVHCIIICQWLKTWGADWTLYLFHHCVVYFWSEAFILEESNHMCPEEVISSPIVKGHGKRQTLSCVRTPLGNTSLVWDVRSLMGWDVAAGQFSTYIYRFENYFLHSKDKSMHTTFPLWHIALSFCVKRQVKKKKKSGCISLHCITLKHWKTEGVLSSALCWHVSKANLAHDRNSTYQTVLSNSLIGVYVSILKKWIS